LQGGIVVHIRILAALSLLAVTADARAYVEAPYTLGRTCSESSHIVLVEVARVNKEKNLILYKKVQDLKGTHPEAVIKHNIGRGGFHPREWQNVMNWAEPGKRAVFFHNGSGSETCIGTYWYQCEHSGDWWNLSHAEPFMLRTFYGDVDRLAAAVTAVVAGKEVVVPCLADGSKEQLHLRKGKVQRLKASLKRIEYNARRDFVGFGSGDDDNAVEYKTFVLLPASTAGWKFLPAREVKARDWFRPAFDDGAWRSGKAPIGYGEEEIGRRRGTTIAEHGVPFVFRRIVEIPGDLLSQKGVTFRLCVASDDSAVVYLNGQEADRDPEEDHEFQYWNRDVEVPPGALKPGRNLIAVYVKNRQASSDLFLDMELTAEVPIPKPVIRRSAPSAAPGAAPAAGAGDGRPWLVPPGKGGPGTGLAIDREKRTITISCAIAPRKLANLNAVYPIEVVATYPAPRGQKAHETVVVFENVRPSDVHKALEGLGLKPGQPARGEEGRATGPELKLFLEFRGADGKEQRIPLDRSLVNRATDKPIAPLTWHFTGSAIRQPDPEKDEKVYGADLGGTLIALFPVTDDVVIQSNLTLKDEPVLKLETDTRVLPREGTPARLIIEAK
jgi:hypothetical protein